MEGFKEGHGCTLIGRKGGTSSESGCVRVYYGGICRKDVAGGGVWVDGPCCLEDEPGGGGKGALDPLSLEIFESAERVSTILLYSGRNVCKTNRDSQ